MRIHTVVVHHSASPRSTTFAEIEGWHKAKGWRAIGYHYVIDQRGRVHVGREPHETGAHAPPNAGRLGVCVVGDNTRPTHEWNPLQWQALAALVRACRIVWPEIAVVGHRDVRATECPGILTGRLLAEIGL